MTEILRNNGVVIVPMGTSDPGFFTARQRDFLRRQRRPNLSDVVMSVAVEPASISEWRDPEFLRRVVRAIASSIPNIRYTLRFDFVFIIVIRDTPLSAAKVIGGKLQDMLRVAGLGGLIGIAKPSGEAGLERTAIRAMAAGELSGGVGPGVYIPLEPVID